LVNYLGSKKLFKAIGKGIPEMPARQRNTGNPLSFPEFIKPRAENISRGDGKMVASRICRFVPVISKPKRIRGLISVA